MTYIIDPDQCSQCERCVAECPMEAIAENDFGCFKIDPEACTDCGSCADICPEEAIRGG